VTESRRAVNQRNCFCWATKTKMLITRTRLLAGWRWPFTMSVVPFGSLRLVVFHRLVDVTFAKHSSLKGQSKAKCSGTTTPPPGYQLFWDFRIQEF